MNHRRKEEDSNGPSHVYKLHGETLNKLYKSAFLPLLLLLLSSLHFPLTDSILLPWPVNSVSRRAVVEKVLPPVSSSPPSMTGFISCPSGRFLSFYFHVKIVQNVSPNSRHYRPIWSMSDACYRLSSSEWIPPAHSSLICRYVISGTFPSF